MRSLINVDDSLKGTLDSAISSIKYDEESDNGLVSDKGSVNTDSPNIIMEVDESEQGSGEDILSSISDEIVENLKKN